MGKKLKTNYGDFLCGSRAFVIKELSTWWLKKLGKTYNLIYINVQKFIWKIYNFKGLHAP